MSLVVPSSPTEAARSIVLIAIFFLALSKGFHCQTTSKIQLLGSGSTLTEGKKFNFMMITHQKQKVRISQFRITNNFFKFTKVSMSPLVC